jgi:hypothetical protein
MLQGVEDFFFLDESENLFDELPPAWPVTHMQGMTTFASPGMVQRVTLRPLSYESPDFRSPVRSPVGIQPISEDTLTAVACFESEKVYGDVFLNDATGSLCYIPNFEGGSSSSARDKEFTVSPSITSSLLAGHKVASPRVSPFAESVPTDVMGCIPLPGALLPLISGSPQTTMSTELSALDTGSDALLLRKDVKVGFYTSCVHVCVLAFICTVSQHAHLLLLFMYEPQLVTRSSYVRTCINSCNMMMGVLILSLPYALKVERIFALILPMCLALLLLY